MFELWVQQNWQESSVFFGFEILEAANKACKSTWAALHAGGWPSLILWLFILLYGLRGSPFALPDTDKYTCKPRRWNGDIFTY